MTIADITVTVTVINDDVSSITKEIVVIKVRKEIKEHKVPLGLEVVHKVRKEIKELKEIRVIKAISA
jgi:hypothetical protein